MIWILPVYLLDGCSNRDPYLKIDHRFTVFAICGSCPKSLINNDRTVRWDWFDPKNNSFKTYEEFEAAARWELEDISDLKLSDSVIIGGYPLGYFIADRKTGKLRRYVSKDERDLVLKREYGLDAAKDIHPPGGWLQIQSRFLWQWFLSYYIGCLLLIPLITIRSFRKSLRALPPATV